MVILDIKNYIDEANRQFNGTNNYEQLYFDPTELHSEKLKSQIKSLRNENLWTSKTATQTPDFHLLPKINKANNPERPVISSVNWHTSRISEFFGYYLQHEVKKLKSYVKDFMDFVKQIEAIEYVSDDSYLVFSDVRCLYTNLLHKEELKLLNNI